MLFHSTLISLLTAEEQVQTKTQRSSLIRDFMFVLFGILLIDDLNRLV